MAQMWPLAMVVGEGDNYEYPVSDKHYCYYRVMRGSVKRDGWSEHCRCGKFNVVILSRGESQQNCNVKATKQWYDEDGQLSRTTGHKDP